MNLSEAVEKRVIEEALSNIDMSKYEKQVEKAVAAYLKGDDFQESVAAGLSDEGVGYLVGESLAKQLTPALKKLKISLT